MTASNISGFKLFRVNFFLPVFLGLILTSCLAATGTNAKKNCQQLPDHENGGRVSVFLNFKQPDNAQARMVVVGVEILAADKWVALSDATRVVDVDKIGKGQVFLGSRLVADGMYEKLRLTVVDVSISADGQQKALQVPQSSLEVSFPSVLKVVAFSNKILLLEWDVESAIVDNNFNPSAITARITGTGLIVANQTYVACPEIDTIYVIRNDKNWVNGSIFVSGRPTYLVADPSGKKLYILAVDEARIKVVDMVSLMIIDDFKIPISRKLIHMTVSPDFQYAYVLDERGNLSKIDLQSGNMLARNRIGLRPGYVYYLTSHGKLVVSSALDHSIYFVDVNTLDVLESFAVTGIPQGVAGWNNLLFIAEKNTNVVSIYDLNERRIVKSVLVGYGPVRLTVREGSIYVSKNEDAGVSFLREGLFSVSKNIKTGSFPNEMAVAEYQRALYVGVGDDCDGGITVVDLTANRIIENIELGAKPAGLALIQ